MEKFNDVNSITDNRINSLQGLRFLAFLTIFFEHSGVCGIGGLGVSIFFVLSGFLLDYNQYNKTDNYLSFRFISLNNIKYGISKIKKLYLLHLITFLVACCTGLQVLFWFSTKKAIISILKICSNIIMFQSLIPKSEFYFSFNSVSWYLSTTFFLYIFFPTLYGIIHNKRKVKLIVYIIGILLYQCSISIVLYIAKDYITNVPMVVSDDLTKYITYICPFYRVGDFFIGIILGELFWMSKNGDMKINNKFLILIEFLSIIYISFSTYVFLESKTWEIDAFRYTLLYLPGSTLLIYCLATENTYLSKLLSKNVLVKLGDLTPYAFLIHQLVISFVIHIIDNCIPLTIISFLFTLLLSYLCIILKSIRKKIIK